MQSNVDLVLRAKDQASKAVDDVSNAVASLERQMLRAQTGANQYGSATDRLGSQLSTFKNRLQALQALDAVVTSIDKATVAVKRLDEESAHATAEAARLRTAYDQVKASAAGLRDEAKRAGDALAAQEAKAAGAKASLNQLDRALTSAEQKQAALTRRVAEAKAPNEALNQQLARNTQEVEALRQKHAAATATLSAEQQQVASLSGAYQSLNDRSRAATVAERNAGRASARAATMADVAQTRLGQGQGELNSIRAIGQPISERLGVDMTRASVATAQGAAAGAAARTQRAIEAAQPREIPAGVANSYDGLVGKVVALASAYLGLQAAMSGLSAVVTSYRTIEAAQNRLGAVFDQDKAKVAGEMDYLSRASDRLGLSFKVMADTYGRLSISAKSANLTVNETRKLFEALSIAGRVNKLSSDQMSNAFLAVEQMLSKGKVQAQELRLQLGNALPGAFSTFARALGVTTEKLGEMMEAGQVLADSSTMSKFAAELQRMYGGQLAEALTTVTTQLDRFQNGLFKAQVAVGEGGFMEALRRMLIVINDLAGTKAANDFFLGLGAAAGKAVNGVTYLLQNLDKVKPVLAVLAAMVVGRSFVALAGSIGLTSTALTGFLASAVSWNATAAFWSARLATLQGGYFALRIAIGAGTAAVWQFAASLAGGGAASTAFNAALALLRGGLMAVGVVATTVARGLLAAFGGIPGIIATIVTFVAGSALMNWLGKVEDTTAAVEEHKRIMGQIGAAYEAAADKAGDWAKNVKNVTVPQAEINYNAQKDELEKLRVKVAETATGTRDLWETFKSAFNQNPINEKVYNGIKDLAAQFAGGKITAEDFSKKLDDLYRQTDNPQIRKMALEFIKLADQAKTAQGRVSESALALDTMNKQNKVTSLSTEELRKDIEKTALTWQKYTDAINGGVAALKTTVQLNEQLQKAQTDQRKDIPEYKDEEKRKTDQSEVYDNATKVVSAALEAYETETKRITGKLEEAKAKGDTAEIERLTKALADEQVKYNERVQTAYADFVKATAKVNEDYAKSVAATTKEGAVSLEAMWARISQIESGGNARAKNPRSSATGAGQFIESTWLEWYPKTFPKEAAAFGKDRAGMLNMRNDPEVSKAVGQAYIAWIQKQLQAANISPTLSNVYAGYHFGPGGAKALLNADPKANAAAVLQAQADAASKTGKAADIAKANPWIRGLTVEEAKLWLRNYTGENKIIQKNGLTEDEEEANKKREKRENQIKKSLEDAEAANDEAKWQKANNELGKTDKRAAWINNEVHKDFGGIDTSDMTKEQLAELEANKQKRREIAEAAYEVDQRDKDNKGTLQEQMTKLEGLVQKRKELREEMQTAKDNGEVEKAQQLKNEVEQLAQKIREAADAALPLAQRLGDDKAIASIGKAKRELADVKDQVVSAKQANDMLASGFSNAFGNAVDHIGKAIDGTEKWGAALKGIGNAFRQFAADFLKRIAMMILQQMALNALQGLGVGKFISGAVGGLFHEGGIAGAATTGVMLDQSAIDGAFRYHVGGIAGEPPKRPLLPGEVHAVLERGEEILTEDDPRHARNLARQTGSVAGQAMSAAAASIPAPEVKIRNVNLFDASEVVSSGLETMAGEQGVLNAISRQKRQVRELVNS